MAGHYLNMPYIKKAAGQSWHLIKNANFGKGLVLWNILRRMDSFAIDWKVCRLSLALKEKNKVIYLKIRISDA